MGEVKLSNIKRPESIVKMLIVCLSVIAFALLLVGLKCHNNNIHIPNNLNFNQIIAASYFKSLELVANEVDSIDNNFTKEQNLISNSNEKSNSNSDAHHLFECVLFKYKIKNSELFLLLVNFMYFFVTCLTMLTCIIQEGFTKNMDVIFHIIGFFLYLCSTVWILVEETEIGKSYETRKNIIASAVEYI